MDNILTTGGDAMIAPHPITVAVYQVLRKAPMTFNRITNGNSPTRWCNN